MKTEVLCCIQIVAFWPCIDSNTTDTFKVQKGNKDIIKTVHVTSVAQP